MKKTIVVLISNAGKGTNLQAIVDAIKSKELKATVSCVISGSSDALGLIIARRNHIPTLILKNKDDGKKILRKLKPDLIVLAGWKRIVPDHIIKAFPNKILNIHPGLIPDTPDSVVKNPDGTIGLWNQGKLTDTAVKQFLDMKATYAGSSVHFLTSEFDFGPVLGRCFEKIRPKDTVESLYARLKKKENELYVAVLKKLCSM